MPPLIVWAIGAIGAVLAGRLIAREAQRIRAELRARQRAPQHRAERDTVPKLERDPVTGIYRPKSRA